MRQGVPITEWSPVWPDGGSAIRWRAAAAGRVARRDVTDRLPPGRDEPLRRRDGPGHLRPTRCRDGPGALLTDGVPGRPGHTVGNRVPGRPGCPVIGNDGCQDDLGARLPAAVTADNLLTTS